MYPYPPGPSSYDSNQAESSSYPPTTSYSQQRLYDPYSDPPPQNPTSWQYSTTSYPPPPPAAPPASSSQDYTPYHEHVPPLPIQIETAFSPHPAWQSLPQNPPYPSASTSSTGPVGFTYSTPVSAERRWAEADTTWDPEAQKVVAGILRTGNGNGGGWDVGLGSAEEDTDRYGKRRRDDADEVVEQSVQQLHTYITELIHLMEPFATTPDRPNPEIPPPFLQTRFQSLSTVIHQSLQTLSPQVHPYLSTAFSSPPSLTSDKTDAEKEMEIIRKRRDALIAKSAPGKVETPMGEETLAFSSRGVPVAPGRCHGCGVEATPEWRRGPDGPASLCNSCGLHYAKLAKKRASQASLTEAGENGRV